MVNARRPVHDAAMDPDPGATPPRLRLWRRSGRAAPVASRAAASLASSFTSSLTSSLAAALAAALVAVPLAAAGAAASGEPAGRPGHRPCPGEAAAVSGANDADLADICQGVADALTFLAKHGVRPTEPVSIEVTPAIPAEAGPTAAGCYIEQRRRVYLVPYGVFRQYKDWFGVGIDRAVYRSLAAHEAAHAVTACNFRIPNPTIQAKEYLAYVTMFSAMPAALRQRALHATPTEGFDSLDRFKPMLYLFDPMRFGAEAYRHFSTAADPSALIQSILSGQALTD